MKPIQTLTDEQSNALLLHTNTQRDRVLTLLLLDAGLRVGEAVQLTPYDVLEIDPQFPTAGLSPTNVSSVLTVPATAAKNKTSRILPLTNRLHQALQTYLHSYFRTHDNTLPLWLFPSRQGKTHLTTRQARRIIEATALRALAQHLHPHVLRHTFATNIMRRTDLPTLQLLLGHKSLSSTQIYTHPTVNDLRKAIKALPYTPTDEGA